MSIPEDALVEALIAELQQNMWTNAGLLREERTLRAGLTALAKCSAELNAIAKAGRTSRRLSEAQALAHVALAILEAALARTESRGAHFRNDFGRRDDPHFRKHSVLAKAGGVAFEAW